MWSGAGYDEDEKKATEIDVGPPMNFRTVKVEFKRIVYL